MSRDLLNRAIEFAAHAHSNLPLRPGKEFRKGTKIPYFSHPFGVGMLLAQYRYPDHLVIAGLLHDCLEDTQVTEKELSQIFGNEITSIVKGCSEPNKE